MKYSKKVMNRKELMSMGFSETYLMRAFSTPNQTFAWRDNPANRTSPIMFDTDGFEEWRMKMLRAENKAIIRG